MTGDNNAPFISFRLLKKPVTRIPVTLDDSGTAVPIFTSSTHRFTRSAKQYILAMKFLTTHANWNKAEFKRICDKINAVVSQQERITTAYLE
jgi:hypothetical protein